MFILRFFLRPDSLRLMIVCLLAGGLVGLLQTVGFTLSHLRDCTQQHNRTHPECQPGIVLLLNGQIHTATHPPVVEAVAVEQGRVVALGAANELRQRYPSAFKVDLGGNVCLPAFQDPGIWLLAGALGPLSLDLSGTHSVEEWQEPLSATLRTQPGHWVFGHGWHPPQGEGLPLNRKVLDVMSPDRPVFLWRADLEAALLSTLALDALGIRKGTPAPLFGRIHTDPSGHPTGLLEGEAATQAFRRAQGQVEGPRLKQALLEAQTLLLSQGIVRVGTEVMDELTDVIALGELHESGALRLRVHGHPLQSVRKAWPFRHYRPPDPNSLRIEGHIIALDGSPRTGQAAQTRGMSPFDLRVSPRFEKGILQTVLRSAGTGPARIEAHGDQALARVLESLPGSDIRRRPMVRSRVWTVEALETTCRLGGIPLIDPSWTGYSPQDLTRWLPTQDVQPRTPIAVPPGCAPVLSTGWPAGPVNLRAMLDLARLLPTPPEKPSAAHLPPTSPKGTPAASAGRIEPESGRSSRRRGRSSPPPTPAPPPSPPAAPLPVFTLDQALAASTLNVARAYGIEARSGTLAPGSLADLVALEGNPLAEATPRLSDAEVVMTVIGGEVVWRRDSGMTFLSGSLELPAPLTWRKLLGRQYFWILAMSMAMLSWPVLSLLVWTWKRPRRVRASSRRRAMRGR